MRVTIIPSDGSVTIDGDGRAPIDLSFMGQDIHAVQWYETWGEIERKDPETGAMTANEHIADLSLFQAAIDAWNAWVHPLQPHEIPVTNT